MGTKRARPTNNVSTVRAVSTASANVPAPPPNMDDIVARLERISARQQRIEARQHRIDVAQQRIRASQAEIRRIMDGQIPQPPTL